MANNLTHLIFIHGQESNSQTYKAILLRERFPSIVTPDFVGPVADRMAQLYTILGDQTGWTIIGSSLGGLMAALFTCQHPMQVRKQVLLAPALLLPEFSASLPAPVSVPTIVYHGFHDDIVPMELTRKLAERVFSDLSYRVVDDDHRLHKTAQEIDWPLLLA